MDTTISVPIEAKTLLHILPHRYPFLLVDRVVEVEPGQRIRAIKNVSVNEPYFVGHFPGIPIMPGVLQIEMMAQVGGIMLLLEPEHSGKLAFLTGIENAKFRRQVVPGDQLDVEVELVRTRRSMGWVRCVARVDGKIASEAEISFALAKGELQDL